MKDSQDWLDEILDKMHCCGQMNTLNMEYAPDRAVAKSAIREHFLKEALEIIGDMEERETEDMSLQSWGKDDYKAFGRNGLRAELRNKFNDKYKED
jgi:hypothetical protein